MTFDRILLRMRECVSTQNYRMTEHAHDKAILLDITGLEIEEALLEGRIVEQQKDAQTGEAKFIVRHQIFTNSGIEVVVKFGPTGRLYIITIYTI